MTATPELPAKLPTIAIIGRPNVGKSTLFNRLVGRRLALVDDSPGVTRDRRAGEARLRGMRFTVIDTAGLDDPKEKGIAADARAQTLKAIEMADACLFVMDARDGVMPGDRDIAKALRKSATKVILIANKAESRAGEAGAAEATRLGFGEPILFSAEHGIGMDELYEALLPFVPLELDAEEAPDTEDTAESGEGEDIRPPGPLKIAIIGRPNAGKSTLVNALIGEERLVTSPEAGTTRDAISVSWEWQGREIELVDTAGLRKRARVTEKIEKLAVADGLRAVKFAELVIVVIDATIPFESQDLAIADLAAREGRAVVIAANKWDLVSEKQASLKRLKDDCARLLPQLRGVPVIALSAARGEGLERLMDAVFEMNEVWNRRVPTNALNRWLEHALERHPPPAVSGRRIRLRYMTQVKARPPTFAVFGNQLDKLQDEYLRYLINGIRENFGFAGVPVRIHLRNTDNPYAEKERD
ncbi:MAG TPA: ribosome biogenesis GTPase Der [Micropepsaceae bacterium]|nr:ribosome biogenesis GTPase Der [Micropepsaceae bacterium]